MNEKATKAIGETQYCEVGPSVKVQILDSAKDWKKIKVVEPDWLTDTYIEWIPAKNIIGLDDPDLQPLDKLDAATYEIIKVQRNPTVKNFYIFLKKKPDDKVYVNRFIKAFRLENCSGKCNISIYDSGTIEDLVDKYPIEGKEYLKLADHFVSASSFDVPDANEWYPYQDSKYKELGGKHWKKEPVK